MRLFYLLVEILVKIAIIIAVMDMYELLNKDSPDGIALIVAKNFKECRKLKHITQKELAEKSKVPYGTIRQFEQKGKISLHSLILLAEALDLMEDFKLLFNSVKHRTYEDLINEFERH